MPLALDLLSAASAAACYGAYASFRASTAYVGPTVTVRRAGDGATVDFYANANGKLGTALNATGTAYEAWLAATGGTGYVTKWWDQSGRGDHATQATAANQPALDPAKRCVDFTPNGGLTFFALPAGTVPMSGAYTVTVKHLAINNVRGGWLGGGVEASTKCNNFRRAGDGSKGYCNYWWGPDFEGNANAYAPNAAVTFVSNGTTSKMYVNGALQGSQAQAGLSGAAGANETIGKTTWVSGGNPSEYLNGQLVCLYVFKVALADAERAVCESGLAFGAVVAGAPLALSQLGYRLADNSGAAGAAADLGGGSYQINACTTGAVATVAEDNFKFA